MTALFLLTLSFSSSSLICSVLYLRFLLHIYFILIRWKEASGRRVSYEAHGFISLAKDTKQWACRNRWRHGDLRSRLAAAPLKDWASWGSPELRGLSASRWGVGRCFHADFVTFSDECRRFSKRVAFSSGYIRRAHIIPLFFDWHHRSHQLPYTVRLIWTTFEPQSIFSEHLVCINLFPEFTLLNFRIALSYIHSKS